MRQIQSLKRKKTTKIQIRKKQIIIEKRLKENQSNIIYLHETNHEGF